MPLVRIDLWPGQSRERKNALIRNVTNAIVEAIGCPVDAVEILINETDKADWARGGVSHADRLANADRQPHA